MHPGWWFHVIFFLSVCMCTHLVGNFQDEYTLDIVKRPPEKSWRTPSAPGRKAQQDHTYEAPSHCWVRFIIYSSTIFADIVLSGCAPWTTSTNEYFSAMYERKEQISKVKERHVQCCALTDLVRCVVLPTWAFRCVCECCKCGCLYMWMLSFCIIRVSAERERMCIRTYNIYNNICQRTINAVCSSGPRSEVSHWEFFCNTHTATVLLINNMKATAPDDIMRNGIVFVCGSRAA